MAKKETLVADDFGFDYGDLDLDFESEIDGGINQEAFGSSKRSVIENVARGVAKGAADTVSSGSFIRSTLRKSLPDEYGEVATGMAEINRTLQDMYQDTVNEIKPRIQSITEKVDALVPEEEGKLRRGMDKFKNWIGVSTLSGGTNQESQEDQFVNASLAMFEQQQASEKIREKKQLVRDGMEHRRFGVQANILESIDRSSSITAQYTTSVNQAYQKRSLELQLRSYFSQRQFQGVMKKNVEAIVSQLEAVVKNTALPEYVKITESERFMEISKRRFVDSLYGEGSILQQGLSRIKDKAKQAVSGFGMSLDQIDFSLDSAVSAKEMVEQMNEMLESMGEEPLTSSEMAGMQLGASATEWARNLLAKRAKEATSKNSKLVDGLATAGNWMLNPGAAINKLRSSEKWREKTDDYDSKTGSAFRFFDSLLSNFYTSKDSPTIKGAESDDDLRSPSMGFDRRAHLSLVDVIPGHLAAIRREISMLRTGEETELVTFDYNRREFVTDKTKRDRTISKLATVASKKGLDFQASQAVKHFSGDLDIDEVTKFELKRYFVAAARVLDEDYDPSLFRDLQEYETLSPRAKAVVELKLKEMEDSTTPQKEILGVTKRMTNIREAMPSFSNDIDDIVRSGDARYLEEEGLVKRTDDGDYEKNEEAIDAFLEKHGLIASDRRTKTAIRKMSDTGLLNSLVKRFDSEKWRTKTVAEMKRRNMKIPRGSLGNQATLLKDRASAGLKAVSNRMSSWSPTKALEGIKNTPLFSYLYKDGMGDDQEHLGPMAQDIRNNLGDEAAPDGKVIDLQSMNGAMMAAIGKLSDQFDSFKNSAGLSDSPAVKHLRSIDKNVATIAGSGQGLSGGKSLLSRAGDYAASGLEWMGTTIGSVSGAIGSGASQMKKLITDAAEDKNSRLNKAFAGFVDRSFRMGSWVFDQTESLITELIPDTFRSIRNAGSSLLKGMMDRFTEIKDLYIPGETTPVIRAKQLLRGLYYDAETAKPLLTIDDVVRAKNDIVDKAGNVVASAEEIAQGLIDRHGNKIRSNVSSAVHAVGGFVGGLAQDAMKRVGQARDKIAELYESFMQGREDRKQGSGGPGFFGNLFSSNNKQYDVLVDIRDILLGNEDLVRKRMGDSRRDLISPEAKEKASVILSDIRDISLGAKDSVVDKLKKLNPFKKFGDEGQGLFGSVRSFFTKPDEEIPYNSSLPALLQRANNRGGASMTQAADFARRAIDGGSDLLESARESKIGGWISGKKDGLMDKLANSKLGRSRLGGKLGAAASVMGTIGSGVASAAGGFLKGGLGALSSMGTSGERRDSDHERQFYQDPDKLSKVGALLTPKRLVGEDGTVKEATSSEARADRLEKLRQARHNEVQADTTLRYKSEENVIDMMMRNAGKVMDFFKDGMSGLLAMGGDFLGKIPGLGKVFGSGGALSRAGSAIARGAASGARAVANAGRAIVGLGGKGVVGGILKGTGAVAKFAATKVLPVLAGGALKAAAAVGSTLLSAIASPVVAIPAAIAAAGYGAYKLYQYATRNDATELERIRLNQYGFGYNSEVDKYNHRCYVLEAYLEDGRVGFEGERPYIISQKVKAEELLDIAKIDTDDEEAVEVFSAWFERRFKPFFLNHIAALYAVDRKLKLSDIEKLSEAQKVDYLSRISFDSGPYSFDVSPIPEVEKLTTDKAHVKASIDILLKRYREEMSKKATPSKLPQLPTGAMSPTQLSDVAQSYMDSKKAEKEQEIKQAETKVEADQRFAQARLKALQEKAQALSEEVKQAEKDGKATVTYTVNGKVVSEQEYNEAGAAMRLAQDRQREYRNWQAEQSSAGRAPTGTQESLDSPEARQEFEPAKEMDNQKESQVKPVTGSVSSGSIPMAEGAPLAGEGASQYLKLQPGVKLNGIHPRALQHFMGMVEEYGKLTGKTIQVNDGFRTFEDQKRLKAKYGPRAATPGKSLHESGLAIDINSADANALEKLGLMKKYGFTRPVGGEAWHIEPAGVQKNFQLARTDPNKADNMILASLGRGGGGYGTVPGATKYRRNHDLAMSLLNAPASKPPTSSDLAVATDGSALSVSGLSSQAANDSTMETQQAATASSSIQPIQPNSPSVMSSAPGGATDAPSLGGGGQSGGGGASGSWDMPEMEVQATGEATEETGIKKIISEGAKRVGEDPLQMQTMAAVESSMNPNAKASTSSAAGLFQFLRGTWREMLGKHGKKYGLNPNSSPFDPMASTLMAGEYIKANKRIISTVKPNPGIVEVYLAHFLGPGGARTFLKAAGNAIAAQVLPKAAASNRSIFYDKSGRARTISEVYQEIARRISEKAKTVGLSVQPVSKMPEPSAGADTISDTGIGDSQAAQASGSVPTTPSASPESSQETMGRVPGAPAPTSSKPGLQREFIPQSEGSGVFVDPAGNSPAAVQARQESQGMHTLSFDSLEKSMSESVAVQNQMLEVLKAIQGNTDVDKLAEVLAATIASINGKSDSPKERDNAQMGRTSEARQGSLNIGRRVA